MSREIDRMVAENCPNCGKPGPHFVPPSLGDPGFFICEAKGIEVTDEL